MHNIVVSMVGSKKSEKNCVALLCLTKDKKMNEYIHFVTD